MSMPKKITSIYAWIATERDGSEGIPAANMLINGFLHMVPILGADLERIEALRRDVVAVKAETGVPMRLCRFELVEDGLDTL